MGILTESFNVLNNILTFYLSTACQYGKIENSSCHYLEPIQNHLRGQEFIK